MIVLKRAICFFTGTGNSYHVALKIQERFPDASLFFIPETDPETLNDFTEIGIVSPVYFFGLPDIVRRFVEKMTFPSSPRIYAIFTCGGGPGIAIQRMAASLKKVHKTLAYSATITMPDNYILLYFIPSQEKRAVLLQAADLALKEILTDLESGKANIPPKNGWNIFGGIQVQIGKRMQYTSRHYQVKGCVGCLRCVKTCPTQNIVFENNTVHFGKNCTGCLGCIHACPVEAIQYGKRTQNKGRYVNPNANPIQIRRKQNVK
jgi:ferredoxin/flavodoxin